MTCTAGFPLFHFSHGIGWIFLDDNMKNLIVTFLTVFAHSFQMIVMAKHNLAKGFESYFLSFSSGARLEVMTRPEVAASTSVPEMPVGLTHLAFSVGSKACVDSLTAEIRRAGYAVVGEPRTTGDGYYESIIADPDGNLIEITV